LTQYVIVRDQIPKRAAHVQFKLTAFLTAEHREGSRESTTTQLTLIHSIETLEEIPRRFKVIETVREKFTCRDCEAI